MIQNQQKRGGGGELVQYYIIEMSSFEIHTKKVETCKQSTNKRWKVWQTVRQA